MIVISIVFFILALLASLIKDKSIKSPLVLFNFVWLLLISMSIIGYEGIERPSETIYAIFVVGGITFNIFYLMSSVVKVTVGKPCNFNNDNNYTLRFNKGTLKFVRFTEICLLIYYIVKAITLLNQLRNGLIYGDIRSYYYSEQFMNSTMEYLAITYIIDPLVIVTELIFSISLFKKIFSKGTMGLMLAVVILRTFVSGGRMVLFEFAILVAFCYLIYGNEQKTKFKKKIAYLLLLTSFVILAGAITAQRGNSEGGFFEKIYEMLVVNFTGSFTYFDRLLENGKFIPHTWGRTIFAGIIDPFIAILRFLGLSSTLTSQVAVGNITSGFLLIGRYSYNAMPTMYYYFITDFGMLGIVIGSALFAVISSSIYKKFKMGTSDKSTMIYLILILMIIESPMTWLLFKSQYMIAIILVMIIFNDRFMIRESEVSK